MIALMLYPLIGHGVVLPTDATDDAGVLQNGSVRPLTLVADFDESRTVRFCSRQYQRVALRCRNGMEEVDAGKARMATYH